ncbi:AAA family ATPase [Ramlibacter sp. XY19]|uniref:ATP-binding protein n=1 Tax=Ramlibacter paludis TaxID=2908000 RepID=UPI0023DC38FE|nr:AAA family ATPase [Ramlibacter paludis]MCG2593192.1 AAA family ATPase [Ramlibacter paludis]
MKRPDDDHGATPLQALIEQVRLHTRQALAQVALRVARALRDGTSGKDPLAAALAFAERFAADTGPVPQPRPGAHPLARIEALLPSPVQAKLLQDVLLLACLPQAHEGLATLCRLLHPDGQPQATAALALRWLEAETPERPFALRDQLEALLCEGPVAALRIVQLQGDGPWHGQSLVPGPAVWDALMARAPQLDGAELVAGYAEVPGLQDWMAQATARRAIAALRQNLPCQLLLLGGDAAMRTTRVRALLGAAHATAVRTASGDRTQCATACTAAFMHQAALWLEAPEDAAPIASAWPQADWPLTVLASARNESQLPVLGLPLLRLEVEALAAPARRSLWQSLLPQLGEEAGMLAARYPIEPDDARDVVRDLALRQAIDAAPLALEQVAECIRARTPWSARPGVQRIAPRAGWSSLLLPEPSLHQLEAAVRRVLQQITVLDDWGFAQGRGERRGVRLLLFGPPGTGKTLAAEVIARALGVDLLSVDLASLVSKWIGETEKNLAAVFELAERSRALLLFDEADALFARRTEANDAHDRYANLETAYLLQRLERYEGVSVLTTNLRANLDSAFARRFEFIVEFPEPDAAVRESLWRVHLPASAPLAADVDLAELAAWYPISGAQIRNAALAAAFLAAAGASAIHQRHFLLAVEREYDKAGRAHPGFPAHQPWPADQAPPPQTIAR